MKTLLSFPFRSWVYLLLLHIASLVLSVSVGGYIVASGIFRDEYATAKTVWIIGGTLYALWALVSSVALKWHVSGLSHRARFFLSALIGAPVATFMFVIMWQTKNTDLPYELLILLTGFLTFMLTGFCLIGGALLVDLGKWLGDVCEPVFDKLGFKPSL